MINHAMFQRNGRCGYVLKPEPLRVPDKQLLLKRTSHLLEITVISAQQLPRLKDSTGKEIVNKSILDPSVEVSVHVPDWAQTQTGENAVSSTSAATHTFRTSIVKNNGFNPVWEERLRIPFECAGNMLDLIFVRFAVQQGDKEVEEPIAVFCASLSSLQQGTYYLV
jgi:phosphatidylinositol phospholipase C, delta